MWETAVRVSKAKLSGDDSDSCLLLSLLLAEVQNLLLRLFEVVDAACTLSTNGLKASHGSFVMDDFMSNLFGFPPCIVVPRPPIPTDSVRIIPESPHGTCVNFQVYFLVPMEGWRLP